MCAMEKDLLTTLATLVILISVAAPKCWPRDYGFGSPVCVCGMTYCDFIGDIGPLPKGAVIAFESSKAGLRFKKTVLFREERDPPGNNTLLLVINPRKTYQEIFGFGGAFTDAVGLNLRNLSMQLQDAIIGSYYSTAGIEYSIARIPMASTDFSVRKYTYDDSPNDFFLLNFTLAAEDIHLKIPYIKRAMHMSRKTIWFYGSPWSSPAWMKTSQKLEGSGFLKGLPGGPFYKTWAAYFVRFVQEYEREGIPIWGLTVQNEPSSGFIPFYPWQTLGFTPQTERDFIKYDLGPALNNAGYGNLKLMMLDDNRLAIRRWTSVDLNHWASGWTDWNLALNTHGGPNWAKNFVDSPIIVNSTAEEFYKQPMYYALGHFSKFLPRGSVRIGSRLKQGSDKLKYAAFLTPDLVAVVIAVNTRDEKIELYIEDVFGSTSLKKVIEKRSITTFMWQL
ncbi:lysosomal acid glucosylceramidase-like isoform X2 [Dermacentor variabilis]|uniref:lysosomal acid glucosylceramidase-like isoform X2 n=1 Tax=Dermacentor variabilis TaxID=34621 RepID=UPI003F5C332F